MSPSRRLAYASAGLLLSAGAPVGLFLVRLAAGRASPWLFAEEWAREGLTYAYVTLSTATVFAAFGAVLGGRADELTHLATVDGLTRLPNRRGLMARLESEVSRSRRYGQPLSILLVDLDHLKRINDRRGHDAGDDALRRVGDAIRFGCRTTDVAGRWGGDEFLVLAPSTPLDEARRLGERIRDSVAGLGGLVPLTVSVGIASTVGAPAASPPDLLRRADAALYAAKRRGRNQVASDDLSGLSRGTAGKAVSSKETDL
jgi:diguanylate cyclase (GGDEF)-like protein